MPHKYEVRDDIDNMSEYSLKSVPDNTKPQDV
jgi:hypothetical protein